MRKSVAVLAGLSMMAVSNAGAQASVCPAGTALQLGAQDACQMAVDVFQVMAPQLGLALAGGNATLGRGSALGGPGHFSIGLRANVFNGDLPKVTSFPTPSTTGAVQRTGTAALPVNQQVVGLPTADAAIGLFGGVPLGLTNVGGIDLLVSASFVPTVGDENDDIQVKPDRNLQLGYGVRIGLLQESIVVPGVSFTYLKRDLPTTSITGTSPNLDVFITDATVKTSAYRVVASKGLLLFGVAAGVGQDRYDQSTNVQGVARDALGATYTSDIVPLKQKLTRTNYFLDLSLNLPVLKLIGEVGQVSGGTVDTYNEFESGRADKSRTYGSVGLRLGF
ncbi:MAG TPA: hypothetical protein VL328_04220 [Gemmatimonadaceae bacterium]|jgi:hypothetical protein|nr:hypothetical protein [Gemmatimonadaceae bacterium]